MANKLDIFVLLTGSNGYLGQKILRQLVHSEIRHTILLHSESIEKVNWNPITHVINCAAVLPAKNNSFEQYYEGNVKFLETLIPFAKGKCFIHFTTASMFYRLQEYQISKMIGDALLFYNRSHFLELSIIPLPTIDDEALIEGLVKKVNSNEDPIIDDLTYLYSDSNIVAEYVVHNLSRLNQKPIPMIVKNLYEEVAKRVESKVKKGNRIKRECLENGLWVTTAESIISFNILFSNYIK